MSRTACPTCGNTFEVPSELMGKKGRCDQCQGVFEIAPAPQMKKPPIGAILLGLAGLAITTAGLFTLLGPNAKSPEGAAGSGAPNGSDSGSGAPDQPAAATLGSNTQGTAFKQQPGEATGGSRKNSGTAATEEADPRLDFWTNTGSPFRSDGSAAAKSSVLLAPGKRASLNGRVLALEVPEPGLHLFLPRGRHRVAQAAVLHECAVEESYAERYRKELVRRSEPGNKAPVPRGLDYDALVAQKTTELDHPDEPLVSAMLGHVYMSRGKPAAAARAYRRALAIDPAFPPAHLDLAVALIALGDKEGAKNELRLAEDLDGGGAFGLERALAEQRYRLNLEDRPSVTLDPSRYCPKVPEDDGVVSACLLMAQLSMSELDAVAALNNAALRLLGRARHDDAYGILLVALGRLKACAVTVRGRLIATTLYRNLARLYEAAGWPEKDEIPILERVFPQRPQSP